MFEGHSVPKPLSYIWPVCNDTRLVNKTIYNTKTSLEVPVRDKTGQIQIALIFSSNRNILTIDASMRAVCISSVLCSWSAPAWSRNLTMSKCPTQASVYRHNLYHVTHRSVYKWSHGDDQGWNFRGTKSILELVVSNFELIKTVQKMRWICPQAP